MFRLESKEMSAHKSDPLEHLTATLDRFENGRAILRFIDRQELHVPRRFLPKTAQEGTMFALDIQTLETAGRKQAELARAILAEILNGQ